MDRFLRGYVLIDLPGARALLLRGTLKYQDATQVRIEFVTETEWKISGELSEREAPDGNYLVLILPYGEAPEKGSEPVAREMVSIYVALATAVLGRNAVFQKVYENVVLADERVEAFSPPVESPLWHNPPDVSDNQLKIFKQAGDAIEALAADVKTRIRLSLRWFEKAAFDSGVDALLAFWIAIETLSMPDDTNIRPVNEILAREYGLTYEEARERFKVGRLSDLRSKIVHRGLIVAVDGHLLLYLNGIYVDLLSGVLRLPFPRAAERVMQMDGFDLATYLPRTE